MSHAMLAAPALATLDDLDTADHSRPFQPSPFDEAFYMAFNLGLDGEDPALPEEFPADGSGRVNRAFLAGFTAGRQELKRERDEIMTRWSEQEFAEWVDAMEAAHGHLDGAPHLDDERAGAIGMGLPYED